MDRRFFFEGARLLRQGSARFFAIAGIILAVLVTAATASAQKNAAAGHLRAGRAAAARSDWTTALTQYEAAEGADDSVEALEGIADAEFHLGRDEEGYTAYVNLDKNLDRFKLKGRRYDAVQQLIARRIAELEARTGKIVVNVEGTGGNVFLDERSLGAAPVTMDVRVKPGSHRLHVELAAGAKQERAIDVAAGAEVTAQLRLQPPAPAPSAGGGAPSSASSPDGGAPSSAASPDGGAPSSEAPARGAEPSESPRPSLTPIRATTPPRIDGVLDDPIWKEAPRDGHFFSTRSIPYGKPSAEPTTVMIAYDEKYLYVAFQCGYSGTRTRDDSYTITDVSGSDSVTLAIDPLHDRANALMFVVTRAGSRADEELTQNGAATNPDWNAIWDSATTRTPDAWYAELRIPWGAMRLPDHDGKFSVGVNFMRQEPTVSDTSFWSLPPPGRGTALQFDPTFYGTLDGLDRVKPNLRLYVQPYVAVAYDQNPGFFPSRLNDFAGTGGNFRAYAGAYLRYQPPGPFRFEATANPDFSAAPPDATVANFNRFELQYPEVRPFFAEDNPRFFFGDANIEVDPVDPTFQLFYSRRVGLITNPVTGATTQVPIIYAAKAVFRGGDTEVAGMAVGLSSPTPKITLEDNVGVLRFIQHFGQGRYIGGILLGRTGGVSNYVAGGIDGAFTLYERRLELDVRLARSATEGAPSSGLGEAVLWWHSQNLALQATYLDVGSAFDAQLGYLPQVGVRTAYPLIVFKVPLDTDEQKRLIIGTGLNDTRTRNDTLVYDHGTILVELINKNGATVFISGLPSVENVAAPFPLFAGRLTIPNGLYHEFQYTMEASTAARLPVVATVGYTGGDLFAGQERAPYAALNLNLGHFVSNTTYQLFWITYQNQEFWGHSVTGSSTYSYSPLARTTLILNANTLIDRAVAQLLTSYTFGLLSTVTLTLTKSTGPNTVSPSLWTGDSAPFSAVLSFAYGISPS